MKLPMGMGTFPAHTGAPCCQNPESVHGQVLARDLHRKARELQGGDVSRWCSSPEISAPDCGFRGSSYSSGHPS